MLTIAIRMLLHHRTRVAVTISGIGVAFFLSAAQIGLLVGWCETTSALVRHAGVDIWVMAPRTPAFDYGTPIPRTRLRQTRNVAGIESAEALYMGWNFWQRPDGRRVNVELVGLDDGLAGGPWKMTEGDLQEIYRPHSVVVDDLYLDVLGIKGIGEEAELLGKRAVVRAISGDVRTFTTSPFIFTSLKSALQYDERYRKDEITYVLVRCSPGYGPRQVRDAIEREVPHVEALTSDEFARRTAKYWMLETGAGLGVVITAGLGLLVATVIISQTLFAITHDHMPNYVTLFALGFTSTRLVCTVLAQSLMLGIAGVMLGSAIYFCAAYFGANSPIPLATDGIMYVLHIGVCLASSVLASCVAIRSLFKIDPVLVFRG